MFNMIETIKSGNEIITEIEKISFGYEVVVTNRNLIMGVGTGTTIAEAKKNALNDLGKKIMTSWNSVKVK